MSPLIMIVSEFRDWAGRPWVSQSNEGEDPTQEEMEDRLRKIMESFALMDDLFGRAWEGMQRIVAHEFGQHAADRLTLKQPKRFRDAMLFTLTSLFPDHGEPAVSKLNAGGRDGLSESFAESRENPDG
jgi:hypothetical protein